MNIWTRPFNIRIRKKYSVSEIVMLNLPLSREAFAFIVIVSFMNVEVREWVLSGNQNLLDWN